MAGANRLHAGLHSSRTTEKKRPNMQRIELQSAEHQTFIELCALYPTGNLSSHELSILRNHLEACESCRTKIAEYREFDRQLVPLLATALPNTNRRITSASE